MNELAGLLEDIRQNPEDDTPRLVCADWYEDAGEIERATLIRLQCQQARLPAYERDPAIERTISALIKRYGAKWLGPLRGIGKVSWERGFPSEISINASSFIKYADIITSIVPAVTLHRASRRFAALADCGAFRSVRSLTLAETRVSPEMFGVLCRSRHLASLAEFRTDYCGMTPAHVEQLGAATFFPQLQRLDMLGNDISTPGLEVLTRLNPERLKRLQLSHFDMTPELITQLAHTPSLANLEELHLTYNALSASAGMQLARSPYLRKLRFLNLHFGNLNRGGAEAIAASPILSSVERLEIGFNEITNSGIEALAQSPHLRQLRQLNLSHSEGTPIVGRHLARSPFLGQLRTLALHYNSLKDSGVKALLQSTSLSDLVALDLQSCELTAESVQRLAECPQLEGLRTLNLSGNPCGGRAATALIRSPYLQQLWILQGDIYTFTRRGSSRLKQHFSQRYVES